jgi:hypothetical protein
MLLGPASHSDALLSADCMQLHPVQADPGTKDAAAEKTSPRAALSWTIGRTKRVIESANKSRQNSSNHCQEMDSHRLAPQYNAHSRLLPISYNWQ